MRIGVNFSYRNVQLKCLQVNLQHSRVVVSNLAQVITQYNIDIAFIHEPYTIRNNVAGFPKGFKIYSHGGGRKRAAVIINNNEVDAITLTQGSHEEAILTETTQGTPPVWCQSIPTHRQRHRKRHRHNGEHTSAYKRRRPDISHRQQRQKQIMVW
jgi:hypothetical protein